MGGTKKSKTTLLISFLWIQICKKRIKMIRGVGFNYDTREKKTTIGFWTANVWKVYKPILQKIMQLLSESTLGFNNSKLWDSYPAVVV